MSAPLDLYRLQQVDSSIDRVNVRLAEIHKTLTNDEELRNAVTLSEKLSADLAFSQNELKIAEEEAEQQKIKIQQVESSLYGGSVHNPKELQDLQKDAAALKRHLSTLEERQLEVMLKVEVMERGLDEARKAFEVIKSRLKDSHRVLLDEQARLMNEMERLGEERSAAITPVNNQMLNVYSELRKQKRGLAVTSFSEDACSSCGSILTQAIQQNAKSLNQLTYCPSCGRILYAS